MLRITLLLLLLASSAVAQSGDVASIAALREQGDYKAAEQSAQELWQQQLTDRQRADLAIQLALIHSDQARAAAPADRDALWKKADEACATFLEDWPDNPRRPLVEVQRALVSVTRGTQLREELNTTAALPHFRTAARGLASIAGSLDRTLVEQRLRPEAQRPPDALTTDELESLESHVAYHLARAERQTGLCYAAGTPDRDDMLLRAAKRLTPLVQQSPPDELIWNARTELIACQHDLGNPQTAQKLITHWSKDNPPPEFAATLKKIRDATTATQRDATKASPLQRAGRAASSTAASRSHPATNSSLTAAATARAAGNFADAATKYREFALAEPDHPRAAESHRLAILSTADLLRDAPDDQRAAVAQDYESLLHEHVRTWPSQATADEVRLWLGRLLTARNDWPATVDTLQLVRTTSPHYAEAIPVIAEAYDQQLRRLSDDDAPAREKHTQLLTAATHFLQPIITGPDNRWPSPWSDLQQDAAIELARLHIRHGPPLSSYAAQLLIAALRDMPPAESADANPNSDRENTVKALLIGALARNGKLADAHFVAENLTAGPPEVLLESLTIVADQLQQTANPGDAAKRSQLAQTLVKLVDARHSELDEKSLAQLNACRAAIMAATGDRAAALAQYAALAAASPDDGEVQERYATLLTASDVPEELRQALALWQTIESRTRRGTGRWRRARSARIDLLKRLGENEEAAKLLQLTRLLYPNWDTASTTQTSRDANGSPPPN